MGCGRVVTRPYYQTTKGYAMSSNVCQYCGGGLAAPSHKNCQWCNVIIGEANCNGVYEIVMQAAESVKGQVDLAVENRRAEIQTAYDAAIKSKAISK
jgi:hypothetical protein